ncbi:chemotaxis protein CheA [Borrelia miyamotoi]|uniref:Chemotaxis protein CheA n=1 Tax=Borrelia miyamotoi TaxID=47466 RepID=A0AAX3JLB3_9SPIR|nr:chemotaxis protein CheA [Borrelia miyamotoi]QFP41702.1 chemotaxis protein CheA [Borrelia miyamotoi]QFP47822.1 chemotaxis protein CheA [Borrelia miyamotoi]QGT55582.1 chemotaxis protein CheA [Borrelia miyamotoi]QGT56366.1 chemotaxis protein CheA [Borrelia miyamotoi]WAZ71611.1 chemotaxis protein CheA [Borrelia miyamotoi]
MIDSENEELLEIFFEEAQNLVDTLEENIMSLDDDPNNTETIDEIFRAAHTLKGSSASVDMMELSGFTHVIEDVFDAIRDNKLKICNNLVDLLLGSLDVIKSMLDARLNGNIYLQDVSDLKIKLRGFLEGEQTTSVAFLDNVSDDEFLLSSRELSDMREGLGLGQKVLRVSVYFNEDNPMVTVAGIQMFQSLKDLGPILYTVPNYEQIIAGKFLKRVDYYLMYSNNLSVEKKINLSDVALNYVVDEFDIESELAKAELREKNIVDNNTLSKDELQLSSDEIVSLKEYIGNAKLFEVKLNFNKDNPMATISGLQMLQALRSLGEVYKSIPHSEDLLTDKFFDCIVYYLISNTSVDSISRKVNLSDVVVSFDINEVDLKNIKEVDLNTEVDNYAPVKGSKKVPVNINLIRVDSKRIDYMLNLVSEAVVSKSTYNQINSDMISFLHNFNHFYDSQESFRNNFLIDLKMIFKDIGLDLESSIENQIAGLVEYKFDRILHDISELKDLLLKIIQDSKSTSNRLSRIITDLHESVLKTRMLPVSGIFSRFTRVVRDLSKKLGKIVELSTEGEDTEIDKSVMDDLVEPLMHCVRNSMDHGLETADERLKKGKDEAGHIVLRAKNEGNVISIEIEDDGRGIDPNIIRRKSIEKGLIKENTVLSESEILNLIFSPGFSTANQITDISGRGVGLDVVKNSIKKLNGTIVIDSKVDVGTTFKIKLPLTLVIVQGLLVKSGSEVYVLPLNSVLETHRISEEDIKILENEHEVYNLREEIISVLRLDELFNIKYDQDLYEKFLIVVNINDKKAGIVVDSILGEEDFVVKPIKDKYASSPGIVGAATLGNGKVVLIIDIFGLFDLKDIKE